MAKSLGQIHTINQSALLPTGETGPFNLLGIDIPGQLTEQLQRNIRCGNYFKLVGIDMTMDTAGTSGGGEVSGYIRYYAPTRGRCDAFKGAFKAMADIMKVQGISMRDNKMYDFRVPLNESTDTYATFPNHATLDGAEGLALFHGSEPGASVFDVHNRSQQPQYEGAAGDLFQPGFDTLIQGTVGGTDFVLNDTIMYTGNHNFASTEYEEIPFMLSWTPDSTDLTVQVNWRPDPALYLAVLCGQMQVRIVEADFNGEPSSGLNLNFAVHVSGWKSIMGDPDKKRRKGTRHKKSTSSSKRRK